MLHADLRLLAMGHNPKAEAAAIMHAGNIYAPASSLGMQSVSIFQRGAASDGSGDQLLGGLTGTASSAGVATLQLAAASGTTTAPQGGASAC